MNHMNHNKIESPEAHQSSYPDIRASDSGDDRLERREPAQRVPALKMPSLTPVVTYTLLAVTVLIFLLQVGTQNLLGLDIPAMLGVKANEMILRGQVWRLITPMFLHGSILHLGFNMYALYVIGAGLERFYGHSRFLILYVLAGFCGNVMSFLLTPARSLGSSTAIFGLLGAQGVFLYQNRRIFGRMAQRSLINLLVSAGINLAIGMSPGIDNWGHIGGLIAGTLFAWSAGPVLNVEGIYPDLRLVDARSSGDTLRAALGVAALFAALAVVGMFLKM